MSSKPNDENHALVICGPTATGKTSLALKLAQKYRTHIISADSRQVYRGMDIGTGKDIPPDFASKIVSIGNKKYSVYTNGVTNIYGYDLADPARRYNVADYVKDIRPIIDMLFNSDTPPIIVGGTGYYIQSLLAPPETLFIKPDQDLRAKLRQLSVRKLQNLLKEHHEDKFHSMNHSDQNNPRRLIRAIEVAKSQHDSIKLKHIKATKIGLKLNNQILKSRIHTRITQRIKLGMVAEVKRLNIHLLDNKAPAKTSLGYQEIQQYLDDKRTLKSALEAWETKEIQYAKRQNTWFAKDTEITWFNAQSKSLFSDIVEHLNT